MQEEDVRGTDKDGRSVIGTDCGGCAERGKNLVSCEGVAGCVTRLVEDLIQVHLQSCIYPSRGEEEYLDNR
jgi:hypothetical protein